MSDYEDEIRAAVPEGLRDLSINFMRVCSRCGASVPLGAPCSVDCEFWAVVRGPAAD